MKANEQTLLSLERFIRKIAQKFPAVDNPDVMTDIHVRLSQDSGDIMAFDDDDQEITRCVVEEWIDNKDDHFYDHVTDILRQTLSQHSDLTDHLGIMPPYSFVLEDDEKENIAELYVVDGDTVIIGGELMEGLEQDLNDFFSHLF